MADALAARRILFVLFVTIALVFGYRTYGLYRLRGWKPTLLPTARHIPANVLLAAGIACTVITPSPAWVSALGFILMAYGLLVTRQVAAHILNIDRRRLLHTRFFWIITMLIGCAIVLDAREPQRLGSFLDRAFAPTPAYIAANVLAVGTVLLIELAVMRVYWNSLRQHHAWTSAVAISHVLRRSTALAAFTLAANSLVIIELKLVLALGGITWPVLDRVFTISNIVTGPTVVTLLVISVSLTWFYRGLAHVIQQTTTRRRRQQAALLAYLQQQMRTIVPTVPHLDLRDPHQQWNRMLTEIADAREVVWSAVRRTTPLTPDDEAARIFHLLHHPQDRTTGTYLHPPISDDQIVEHNLLVARAFKRLEQQRANSRAENHP